MSEGIKENAVNAYNTFLTSFYPEIFPGNFGRAGICEPSTGRD
jgi:hypothetical protein